VRAAGSAPLAGELRYEPATGAAWPLGRVVDRVLLRLMHSITPGYLTRGNVPKLKTIRRREIDAAELAAMLNLMGDLGLTDAAGRNDPTALMLALLSLAADRGLVTVHDTGERYRTIRTHGPWTPWDTMSADKRMALQQRGGLR
jgi:hypothetical protein